MEFFRHDTDAGQGRFLTEAMEKFGHFGYTGFFLLLEMYYKKIDASNRIEIKKSAKVLPGKSDDSPKVVQLWYGFHWRVVRQSLRTTPTRVRHLLDYCQTSGVLVWEESPTGVEISVCNVLELLPDTMRRRLGKILNVALEKRREEKRIEEKIIEEERREETKSSQAKPADLHPLAVIWNHHHGNLSKVKLCNQNRIKKCDMRWAEWDSEHGQEDYWVGIVQRIAESTFCNGKNDRGWIATFDWLLQPDTHLKVDEGKYDNRKVTSSTKAQKVSGANKDLWHKVQRGEA